MQFADWTLIYEEHAGIPNVEVFYDHAKAFREFLTAAPDADQQKDLDFLLNVGHLFSLIVYGQLILEQAALTGLDSDMLDQIFDFQVRDFNMYAVALHGKPTATTAQLDSGAARDPQAGARRRAVLPGLGTCEGLRRRLRDGALATTHPRHRRAWQATGAGMTGEPIAVDCDVEVEVQPHRLGHRLAPRNPLPVNEQCRCSGTVSSLPVAVPATAPPSCR